MSEHSLADVMPWTIICLGMAPSTSSLASGI